MNHYEYLRSKLEIALTPLGALLKTYSTSKFHEYDFPHVHCMFGDDIETPSFDAGDQTGNYENVLDCFVFCGFSVNTDNSNEGLLESARLEQLVEIQRIIRNLTIDYYDTGHEIVITKNVVLRGNRPLAETDQMTKGSAVVMIQIHYELIPK